MRTKQRLKALEAAVPCKNPLTVDELHELVNAATDINELSDAVLTAIINEARGLPLDSPIPDPQEEDTEADQEAEKALDALIAASRRQEPGA